MRKMTMLTTALTVLGFGITGTARAETVKIALIDPLSGPVAVYGDQEKKSLDFVLDIANREGWAGPGITFETVGFDNKGSPQEATQQFKNATDQGIRYIYQGLSSAVGLALIDAVNKYNERNPGKEVVYLNPTNTAPEMTNEKCSFWHFRFDSNTDMKSAGLASFLARDKSLKKVYQINQNYATGQGIATAIREGLKKSRPDIEIVGDDLHQMFQVKDFSPYVSKVKASDAQVLVTGNWGADLNLLLKSAKDSGLKIPVYGVNAQGSGTPTALAAANVENVYNLTTWSPNDDINGSKQLWMGFKEKYAGLEWIFQTYNPVKLISQAIANAKSTDPVAVARALEGLKVKGLVSEVEMRKEDHQTIQPMEVQQWTKANGKDVFYDTENTGWGWKRIDTVDRASSTLPSTCQMKRPAT